MKELLPRLSASAEPRRATMLLGAISLLAVLSSLPACRDEQDAIGQFMAGDYRSSFKSFLRRADNGDSAAINFVGIHYYLGLGVERDFSAAAKWFERAARAANADAQRNLGVLYMRGWGVPRDNVTAYGWLFQATSQGNRRARMYLEAVEHSITPNQTMQARKWIADQLRLPGEPYPASSAGREQP
ncbi:MAG: sel1 repeat family protein [Proteobacteria bacterium]|nr:sel1 repeat family protein [Pseudomonadota bacterium]